MIAFKLAAALSCLALVSAMGDRGWFQRINGGEAAEANTNHHCAVITATEVGDSIVRLGGGTIVSNRHIITVAHLVVQ